MQAEPVLERVEVAGLLRQCGEEFQFHGTEQSLGGPKGHAGLEDVFGCQIHKRWMCECDVRTGCANLSRNAGAMDICNFACRCVVVLCMKSMILRRAFVLSLLAAVPQITAQEKTGRELPQ